MARRRWYARRRAEQEPRPDEDRPKKEQATEQADVETAFARIPETDAFLERLVERMKPAFALEPPASVLDVGAAQGVTVTALQRRGFDAQGVEPWGPAIEVSRELSKMTGIETRIKPGSAESLPYESGSFDFIHAYSVMEHVDDPDLVFREAYRVLKAGGAIFFSTTSALSPTQSEIARFPLFPWYPPPLQRAIMDWAIKERPWLVGNTTRPAYHWFKHRKVRRALRDVGFSHVVDRWELRRDEDEGLRGRAIGACSTNPAARLAGDILVSGMEYLAVKP